MVVFAYSFSGNVFFTGPSSGPVPLKLEFIELKQTNICSEHSDIFLAGNQLYDLITLDHYQFENFVMSSNLVEML